MAASLRTGGWSFVVLMAGLALWAFAYAVEIGFNNAAGVATWDKIAFVGSVTVPAALFVLGAEYAGFDDRLPRWAPAVLLVEPTITLALLAAYPQSHLVWESVAVSHIESLTLPVIQFGPWYWVNYAYSYTLIGLSLVMIATVYRRGSRIYRRQSALLIVGALVPLGANLLYNLFPSVSPLPHVDLTTFALAVTGAFYGVALFRFKMLDLAPVARTMALSEVGDGFVVVDIDGDLVEGNDLGRRIVAEAHRR